MTEDQFIKNISNHLAPVIDVSSVEKSEGDEEYGGVFYTVIVSGLTKQGRVPVSFPIVFITTLFDGILSYGVYFQSTLEKCLSLKGLGEADRAIISVVVSQAVGRIMSNFYMIDEEGGSDE